MYDDFMNEIFICLPNETKSTVSCLPNFKLSIINKILVKCKENTYLKIQLTN
jgi:hypothetical protein